MTCFWQRGGDADAKPVLQTEVRQLFVHLHAVQHGGQLRLAALIHHGPDLRHRHGHQAGVDVILCTGAVCLFQQNFIIPLGEDDIGVGAPDLADAGTGLPW